MGVRILSDSHKTFDRESEERKAARCKFCGIAADDTQASKLCLSPESNYVHNFGEAV